MSESVSLRDVPGRFLDQRKWRALRKFTSQELIALTYINAPYPDGENPENFFWGRSGSAEDAIRCYHTGRSLLQQCRYLLNVGQLVTSGVDRSSGKRRTISANEWVNLWPMFATNTAAGPDQAFDDINVFHAEHRNTSHETMFRMHRLAKGTTDRWSGREEDDALRVCPPQVWKQPNTRHI